MRGRKLAIAPVLLACAVLCAVSLILGTRQFQQPNVSLTFVGYTNATPGKSLATFAVSNSSAVWVKWMQILWVKTPTGQ